MRCSSCGSTNIETDYTKGNSYCTTCGVIADEDHVISDVAFDNTKVIGTFVSDHRNGTSYLRNKHGSYICDSRQHRINKAYQEIQTIADKLTINTHIIEQAKRCYLLALDKKFIQGRKTKLIAGVILYALCRQNKTMHMLIDFSDVLKTNLYELGSLYIKIIELLHLSIPQIDPSLYIQRFCNRLKFGSLSNKITDTALKILQSMKRNWLHLGRRPSGLCGAAIMIAAKCHNQNRSLEQVVDVVHVCDGTVKKRIIEFSKTPMSSITKEELDNIKLDGDDSNIYYEILNKDMGMDPPSYILNRIMDRKIYENEVIMKTIEIENELTKKINSGYLNEKSRVRITFIKTTDKITEKNYVLSKNNYIYPGKDNKKRKSLRLLNKNSDKDVSEQTDDDEVLSELNDEEIKLYCLSEEEQILKTKLWDSLFEDWLREQEIKKEEDKTFSIKKKRSSKVLDENLFKEGKIEFNNPIDAMKNSKKLSKKINYDEIAKYLS
jgi:transcription factor IIIB subunit 2